MNNKPLVSVCLAWLLCCSLLPAQSPAPTPAPLVVFPQGDFSCTVEVTPHDIPKPDPAHPDRVYARVIKRIAITQLGKIRRDLTLWSDNAISQLWSLADKGVTLEESNDTQKDVYVLRGILRDQASPKLLHFDADSVSWLTSNALDKSSATGAALHYQAKVLVAPAMGAIPALTAVYQAWIDPKTLMPLKFDDGGALYVLTFSKDPPTGPLVIPADIQAELVRYQEALAPHPHL